MGFFVFRQQIGFAKHVRTNVLYNVRRMTLTDVLLLLCIAALCMALVTVLRRKPARVGEGQKFDQRVNASTGRPAALTPRERQVCGLAAQGMANKEIAAELGLSVNTVQNYLKSAFKKLGVSSRAALANRLRDGITG